MSQAEGIASRIARVVVGESVPKEQRRVFNALYVSGMTASVAAASLGMDLESLNTAHADVIRRLRRVR